MRQVISSGGTERTTLLRKTRSPYTALNYCLLLNYREISLCCSLVEVARVEGKTPIGGQKVSKRSTITSVTNFQVIYLLSLDQRFSLLRHRWVHSGVHMPQTPPPGHRAGGCPHSPPLRELHNSDLLHTFPERDFHRPKEPPQATQPAPGVTALLLGPVVPQALFSFVGNRV